MLKVAALQRTVLLLIVVLFVSGCLSRQLNIGHYESYYDGGSAAYDAGDYATAERRFLRAYWYAQNTSLGTKAQNTEAEAAALYNGALCVGHLGRFEEAEKLLKQTMDLDAKTEGSNGPLASGRFFELARLYQAWGKYTLAVEAYKKAIPLADKYHGEEYDPLAFAVILEDYAIVLEKTGDSSEAGLIKTRAQQIKNAHIGEKAKTSIRYYPAKSP